MKDQNAAKNSGIGQNASLALSVISAEESVRLPIDELLFRLKTSLSGLTSPEAENRLEIYGPNELAKRKKRTAIVEFLLHFRSPLTYLILVVAEPVLLEATPLSRF